MAQKSSLKKLPDTIRTKVDAMIKEGDWTIDEIVQYLDEAGHPKSRSSVGRYVQNIEKVGAKLRQSREITEALVSELGDSAAQGKQGRLLVEMARGLVFELMMKLQDSENAALDTKDVANLGKGLAELGRALRLDQDFETKIAERVEKQVREQAAAAVDDVIAGGDKGLSADTVTSIRAAILGVRPEDGVA